MKGEEEGDKSGEANTFLFCGPFPLSLPTFMAFEAPTRCEQKFKVSDLGAGSSTVHYIYECHFFAKLFLSGQSFLSYHLSNGTMIQEALQKHQQSVPVFHLPS